jgi:protein gp37
MQRSKIEWTDFSINPIRGLCIVDCKDKEGKSYCYARRMYKRFHWDETIRHDMTIWNDIAKIKNPSRIFVGSTMELFGKWVKDEWMEYILRQVERESEHTFIFLTKKPVGLRKWSPFPKNAWVGVSTTGFDGNSYLEDVFRPVDATVKFVSIEPLLDYSPMDFRWVNWVIAGRCTPENKATEPNIEWLRDMAKGADKAHAAVFLKNNLRSLVRKEDFMSFWLADGHLRQEFPIVV